jgi:hypothetical protein
MNKELEFFLTYGGTEKVELEISSYHNSRCLYIGLNCVSGENPESYGDITVNLEGKVPDYCAYVDLNNMPELEKFIEDNQLGDFTGLTKRSGFCEYPLYLFDPEKLRQLCPEGMRTYEQRLGMDKITETKTKVR